MKTFIAFVVLFSFCLGPINSKSTQSEDLKLLFKALGVEGTAGRINGPGSEVLYEKDFYNLYFLANQIGVTPREIKKLRLKYEGKSFYKVLKYNDYVLSILCVTPNMIVRLSIVKINNKKYLDLIAVDMHDSSSNTLRAVRNIFTDVKLSMDEKIKQSHKYLNSFNMRKRVIEEEEIKEEELIQIFYNPENKEIQYIIHQTYDLQIDTIDEQDDEHKIIASNIYGKKIEEDFWGGRSGNSMIIEFGSGYNHEFSH